MVMAAAKPFERKGRRGFAKNAEKISLLQKTELLALIQQALDGFFI